jgi:hypothetical protein
MTKKILISVLATGATIGAGVTVFNLYTDRGTYTAPPQPHQSAAIPEPLLKQERHTKPKSQPSTQDNPLPKAGAEMVAPVPQPRRRSDLFVEATHGEVTLHAENQSLKKVLEALAHESGVEINTQLIVDRPLSIELVRVPLDRALQTILESEDSFFAFASRGQSNVVVKAVWVVPAGTGGQWPPQTSGCARDVFAIEQQLASAYASQRAEAIESLIDLQGPEAAQAVVRSLADQDDDVRYRALQKASGAGVVLPPEVLGKLVQHDRSELVRMVAVDAIGNHPSMDTHDKMTFARYAINDGSPAVQTRASEIVSHLETAPLMREEEEWLDDEAYRGQAKEFQDEDASIPTPPRPRVQ